MALLVPVHILFRGILGPARIVPVVTTRYDAFVNAVSNPLVKLYIFVLVALPVYNWAHRTRVLLPHLGITVGRRYHPLIFYGLAVVTTLITAYPLVSAP
jgi:fumarate reductase subunit D